MSSAAGYAHPDYATVYSDVGQPVALANSGGTLLRRPISGTDRTDLAGCHPLFCCTNWSALGDDLGALEDDVSLVLVADPFLEGGPGLLRQIFDFVRPFKTHYVADLSKPLASFVSSRRVQAARKASRTLEVEVAPPPDTMVEEWLSLQERSRHVAYAGGVKGLSPVAAERLFRIPGVVILRAAYRGKTVGMHVEIQQGEIVFGHLATYDPLYYRMGISTLLHVCEMEYFAARARFIDWGGVPGAVDSETGLSRFKRDFSNTTRTAFLCGSIFDKKAYYSMKITHQGGRQPAFFPAYRSSGQDGERQVLTQE